MNSCRLPLLALLTCAPALAQTANSPALAAGFDLHRPEIVAFINEVTQRDGLKRKDVQRLLKEARPQPKIIDMMNRPIEKVAPWWEYREHFVNPERVSGGAQFWADHRESLEHVAATYQVPPEYVVAILGIETRYGRVTGHYRVLDALATLAFDYPPRHSYFAGELAQFLVLAKEFRLDPLTTTGSYAGAMGAPQFMPSAYRRYAVDASNDQRRDLWGDWDDILASVANYLRQNGWKAGEPVLAETRVDPGATFQLEPHGLEPTETVDSLGARGVKVELDVPSDTRALLILAEQPDGPAYRVGFHNFYVLTRYNTSARYAMAVHDLAQAIAQRVQAATAAAAP
ncbi:MAG TPA: lytic murein transglycosylase B [Steroidobacteraceae bacterium]|nr:lytic murein transglycosylase B [Steroidobacteraceae bacterium]